MQQLLLYEITDHAGKRGGPPVNEIGPDETWNDESQCHCHDHRKRHPEHGYLAESTEGAPLCLHGAEDRMQARRL